MNLKHKILAAALASALSLGAVAPAFADGAASTRNILLGGAAAAILVTNYNHKVRAKRAEQREVSRRQSAYRQWYYHKYGYYPTDQQLSRWYFQTYGAYPK
ncbi:MAG: hypothetical protein M3Y21_09940 [Candidatus Eremiobacteraeota bacterium]|nr:hypothetical protein [Candidatus Eremiobacteraeota bacterium]